MLSFIEFEIKLTIPANGSAMGANGFALTNFAALLFGIEF
jgi:hypothetical protein